MNAWLLRTIRASFLVLSLIVWSSCAVWGQNVGSLNGTVVDSEGKGVPDAKVTVTDTANNNSRTTQTDKYGAYSFSQLAPGTYKLEVVKDKFKNYLAEKVSVQVATATTLDPRLELGVASETVTVSGEAAPALNTQDATVGATFNEQQVKNLPFLARNVVNILTLQPGVVFTGRSNTDLLSMGSISTLDSREGVVNGVRGNQTNVTVDGVDSNDWHNQAAFTSALPVTLDSVQEFRVTTTGANSTDGLVSGAQVALVTKSGSNDFHGNIRWYYRTAGASANSFFNNITGISRAQLTRNIGGGSLGGRIIRDRLYFFLDNEERRDGTGQNQLQTVATDNMRDGVLIYQCNTPSSCPGGTVQGISASHTVAPGFFGLTPANIKTLDPAGIGINPAMLTYMTLFPHGNDPTQGLDSGIDFTGFRFNAPAVVSANVYTARVDYKITKNGHHSIFWRGTMEGLSDTITPAQFPGQASAATLLNNSRGYAVDYTAVFSPTLVNNLRYGLTRQGVNQSGTAGSQFTVRSYSDILNFGARQAARIVPVHDIGDDMTMIRGNHTFQFGGSLQIVTNNRNTQSGVFPSYSVNNGFCINLCSDVTNSMTGSPFPQPSNTTAVTRAFMMFTGSMTQFNDTALGIPSTGGVSPPGTPKVRSFAERVISGYIQDSWHVRPNLVVTLGVRYSYETPVWETGGFQVAPTFDIDKWFQARIVNMNNGIPSDASPLLSWDLAGKANGGRNSWYQPYHKDIMPRLAVAYSSNADSGIGKFIFGGAGKSSLRMGVGFYDDKIGQAIAIGSDVNGSPGTSTALINGSQDFSLATAPRFSGACSATGCTGLPPITNFLPVPTSAVFPFTPASTVSLLGFAVDPHLKTPFSIHFTASFQRELPKKIVVEVAYVGTLGRRLLGKQDYAQYLDIRDPKSGMDLFTAFDKIAMIANIPPPGGSSHAAISPTNIAALQTIQSIPFFDNMLPSMPTFAAAFYGSGSGYQNLTPTQAFYAFTVRNAAQSWSCALFPMDVKIGTGPGKFPSPWNTTVDPQRDGFVLFQPQFQGLAGWTNHASSNYHSLQVSVRKNVGFASFMANYVFSKSIDNASGAENVDLNSTGGAGTFGALIQNPFNLRAGRALSDFNLKHNFNGTFVIDLPFGRGRKFGSNLNCWEDAIIGGWEIVGAVRWHSGFPFGPSNGFNFPTNFELTTPGTLLAPVQTQIVLKGNVGTVPRPNIFADAASTISKFAFTLPGLSGSRNTMTGPAYAAADTGLYKSFAMPWSDRQALQLRVTAFNVFNSVNFNGFSTDPTSPTNFGNFTSTAGNRGGARELEFAARFSF